MKHWCLEGDHHAGRQVLTGAELGRGAREAVGGGNVQRRSRG